VPARLICCNNRMTRLSEADQGRPSCSSERRQPGWPSNSTPTLRRRRWPPLILLDGAFRLLRSQPKPFDHPINGPGQVRSDASQADRNSAAKARFWTARQVPIERIVLAERSRLWPIAASDWSSEAGHRRQSGPRFSEGQGTGQPFQQSRLARPLGARMPTNSLGSAASRCHRADRVCP